MVIALGSWISEINYKSHVTEQESSNFNAILSSWVRSRNLSLPTQCANERLFLAHIYSSSFAARTPSNLMCFELHIIRMESNFIQSYNVERPRVFVLNVCVCVYVSSALLPTTWCHSTHFCLSKRQIIRYYQLFPFSRRSNDEILSVQISEL